MTEQLKPFASLGYEPVGPVVMKLMARYLRTQRKNMRRFFEERGLFDLANRMNQIRKSRQGMMAKNLMFQGVLNEYAATTTQKVSPQASGTEPLGSVQTLRPEAIQGVAKSEPGESGVALYGVAQKESGTDTSDSVQVVGLPDTNAPNA